jgi:hypothetical protein
MNEQELLDQEAARAITAPRRHRRRPWWAPYLAALGLDRRPCSTCLFCRPDSVLARCSCPPPPEEWEWDSVYGRHMDGMAKFNAQSCYRRNEYGGCRDHTAK